MRFFRDVFELLQLSIHPYPSDELSIHANISAGTMVVNHYGSIEPITGMPRTRARRFKATLIAAVAIMGIAMVTFQASTTPSIVGSRPAIAGRTVLWGNLFAKAHQLAKQAAEAVHAAARRAAAKVAAAHSAAHAAAKKLANHLRDLFNKEKKEKAEKQAADHLAAEAKRAADVEAKRQAKEEAIAAERAQRKADAEAKHQAMEAAAAQKMAEHEALKAAQKLADEQAAAAAHEANYRLNA